MHNPPTTASRHNPPNRDHASCTARCGDLYDICCSNRGSNQATSPTHSAYNSKSLPRIQTEVNVSLFLSGLAISLSFFSHLSVILLGVCITSPSRGKTPRPALVQYQHAIIRLSHQYLVIYSITCQSRPLCSHMHTLSLRLSYTIAHIYPVLYSNRHFPFLLSTLMLLKNPEERRLVTPITSISLSETSAT